MDHGKRTLQTTTTIFQHAGANLGSWRSTLFFVYSRKAAFSPIRSQKAPRPPSSEPQPMDSCSPKSVFALAEKVRVLLLGVSDLNAERLGKIGARSLQERARVNLLQVVTAENAVTEYFSKFVNSWVSLSRPLWPWFILSSSVGTHRCFT